MKNVKVSDEWELQHKNKHVWMKVSDEISDE